MKHNSYLIKPFILILSVASGSCWQFFTSLIDFTYPENIPKVEHVKNEFIYGDCKKRNKHFYTHIHLDHTEVTGKIILRGWLDIKSMPTCIILRGSSLDEADVYQNTAYSFQLCIPRVTVIHSQRRYKYFYYEWYIPYDLAGEMNWDLYFYGPDTNEWE